MTKLTLRNIYIYWFILATFYLYQYTLRVAPGVLVDEIRHHFYINADHFSLIGSLYYCGYALMQIPLGILMDRLGIRIIVLYSLVLSITGTIMLFIADDPLLAYIGRFIGGVGGAASVLSALKIANDYLPPSRRAVIIGATLSFGSLGALTTGEPLNYLMDKFSCWQMPFIIFAAVGAIILSLVFIILPSLKNEAKDNDFNFSNIKHDFLNIITNKDVIRYIIIIIGLFCPLLVMADLWGTSFLVHKFNMTREVASPILMDIYVGMALGSIVLPYLAQKYNILDKIIVSSILILLLLFSVIVYGDNLTNSEIVQLLILMGFFCGAVIVCYSGALRFIDVRSSGLAIGVINTCNILSGALLQQVIGCYLDYTWQGQLDSIGLRIYSTEKFVEAFSILVGIIALSAMVAVYTMIIKKTKN